MDMYPKYEISVTSTSFHKVSPSCQISKAILQKESFYGVQELLWSKVISWSITDCPAKHHHPSSVLEVVQNTSRSGANPRGFSHKS